MSYYQRKEHSDAYYEARSHYHEQDERARPREGVGIDKKKYDKNYERIFGKKTYWWEK